MGAVQHVRPEGEVPDVPRLVDRAVGAELVRVVAVDRAAGLLLLQLDHGDQVAEVELLPLVGLDRDVALAVDLDHDVRAAPVFGAGVLHDRAGVALDGAEGQGALRSGDLLDLGVGVEVRLGRDREVAPVGQDRLHAEGEPAIPLASSHAQEHGDVLEREVAAGLELVRLDLERGAGPADHVLERHVLLTHERQGLAEPELLVGGLGVVLVDVLHQGQDLRGLADVEGDRQLLDAGGRAGGLGVVVERATAYTDLQFPLGGVLAQEVARAPLLQDEAAEHLVRVGVGVGDDVDAGSRHRGGDANGLTSHGNLLELV